MKAIWSFWTPPYRHQRRSTWHTELHHWLAWGLSFHSVARYFAETELITDDEGAQILVDQLDLPFTHVSLALNRLASEDAGWWALGKLEAYRRQTEPFLHIDTDVFLWRSIPAELLEKDVIAQNPEPIALASCYRPHLIEDALNSPHNGYLPEEWTWYRNAGQPRAECCGIFGGCRTDFIRHYADTAIQLLSHPENRAAMRAFHDKGSHMILLEQFLLSAVLDYHSNRASSPFEGIEIGYLFDTIEDAYSGPAAERMGFTHLAAGAKRNSRVCADLKRRVQHDLPNHFERCARFAQDHQLDWQPA